jgi:cytochrome P450
MVAATRLPPGPPGHLIQGHQAEFRKDPLALLTRTAREYGDIATIRFGPYRVILVSHPDYVESILVSNARIFHKGPALRRNPLLLGNGLLTNEGESWRRQRRLIQPAFSRQRVTSYGEVMATFAQRAVNGWADGETRDIHAEMMQLTLAIVAKTLFDADVEGDSHRVGLALEAALEAFNAHSTGIFPVPLWIPTRSNLQLRRATWELDNIIFRFVNARRGSAEDKGDLLSILLGARDEDGKPMPARQLRDEVMTLFLAGHETTAIALSWTLYLLARNPLVEARLVAELETVLAGKAPTPADLPRLPYLEATVDEGLRVYPPAWVIGRQSTAPFALGSYQFPEGTVVLVSQWVNHRDPRYFHEPEAFRPERWLDGLARQIPKYAYYPFGGGPRMCIGHGFARMEAALLLAAIMQRYHLELVPGQEIVPQPSITLRPRHGIRMVLRRR